MNWALTRNAVLVLIIISIITLIVAVVYCFIKRDSFENEKSKELNELQIFIINLKHRTDRKDNMIKLMNKLNHTNYTFITPLSKEDSKREMKHYNFNNNILSNIFNYVSVEQYSLLKTVMNIHLDMKKRNIKEYIIAEDDLELNHRNIDYYYINNKYQQVRNNYDMFFLNFCYSGRKKEISNNLFKMKSCLCTGFTIFNNSNNKLSNLLLNEYLIRKQPLDHLYRYIMKKHKLNIYGSVIFEQNTEKFGTDVTGSVNYNKRW